MSDRTQRTEGGTKTPVRMRQNAFAKAPAVCPVCDGQFERRRPWQKFCSNRCRAQSHRESVTPAGSAATDAGHEALSARIQELGHRIEALERRSRSDRLLRHLYHGLERPAREVRTTADDAQPTGKSPATRNARF